MSTEKVIANVTAPRLVLVAPVVPYRGGIAQHSSLLANALATILDTRVYTYTRLYPAALYPGSATTDPGACLPITPPVSFSIDTLNPWTWRKVSRRIAEDAPAAVLLPWWTVFVAHLYIYLSGALRRLRIPLVFFCHNVFDHEGAPWKRHLSHLVLTSGDLFVVQTTKERERLQRLVDARPVIQHPHPIYRQFPEALGTLPRRAPLELLCFGAIRPYKGLDVLLNALSLVRHIPWHLTIVGEPWWGEGERLVQMLGQLNLSDRVETVLRYVSESEAAEYFARADAVVLPYRDATGTGVAAAAYRYRKPIIASAVGGLLDVAQEGKTALLVPPGDVRKLADAIAHFSAYGLPEAETAIGRLVTRMSWESLAAEVVLGVERLGAMRP